MTCIALVTSPHIFFRMSKMSFNLWRVAGPSALLLATAVFGGSQLRDHVGAVLNAINPKHVQWWVEKKTREVLYSIDAISRAIEELN